MRYRKKDRKARQKKFRIYESNRNYQDFERGWLVL